MAGEILTTPPDSPDPKIGGMCKKRAIISTGTELYRFEVPIGRNANF